MMDLSFSFNIEEIFFYKIKWRREVIKEEMIEWDRPSFHIQEKAFGKIEVRKILKEGIPLPKLETNVGKI